MRLELGGKPRQPSADNSNEQLCSIILEQMPPNVICGGPFRYIKSKSEILLADEQVLAIIAAIKSGMRPKNFLGLSTRETKNEHLASLRERHGSATACPKCGKKLVLRTSQKGDKAGQQFLGCTNYPACRFVQSIDNTEKKLRHSK